MKRISLGLLLGIGIGVLIPLLGVPTDPPYVEKKPAIWIFQQRTPQLVPGALLSSYPVMAVWLPGPLNYIAQDGGAAVTLDTSTGEMHFSKGVYYIQGFFPISGNAKRSRIFNVTTSTDVVWSNSVGPSSSYDRTSIIFHVLTLDMDCTLRFEHMANSQTISTGQPGGLPPQDDSIPFDTIWETYAQVVIQKLM